MSEPLINSRLRSRKRFNQSEKPNKRPKKSVANAITSIVLKFSSILSLKRSPANPAGIVPNNTPQASKASPSIFFVCIELMKS